MASKIELTQEENQKLIQEYNSGKSLRYLEKEFGHSRKILSKILKLNEINIRDNSQNSRKFYHDENYFETIDTEPKAYWLGFLYADGFLDIQNNIGITLNSKDKDHLEKFKNCIQSTNPIHDYIGSGFSKKSHFSRILMKSKKTKQDLIDKGMFENKTYSLLFPTTDQVPEELMRHFIRGYFDGDGSISEYKLKKAYSIGFTGTLSIIEGIRNYLNGNWVIKPRNNAYQINIGGNKQVLRILNHLYEQSTQYLDRKYEIYSELYSKYSES